MITKIFNGKCFYEKSLLDLSKKLENAYFLEKFPVLAIFLIGNNFATNSYVRSKILACGKIHIGFLLFKFSKNIKNKTLIRLIKLLNVDIDINGILIQMPLPSILNAQNLFESISVLKDVDVLNPMNFGNYMLGYKSIVLPCTSASVLYFLNTLSIKFKGLHAVIFGASNIVGKPLFFDLVSLGFSCCLISKHDRNFMKITKSADILITAVGIPKFFKSEFVSFGGIVIDVGINNLNNSCIIGDIDVSGMLNKVSWITPVPGGIGPLTVISLLRNVVALYWYQTRLGR